MTDFEYFGTIGAFIAGFVLLIYLFRIRAILMRIAKIRLVQAKAKIHQMSKLTAPEKDIWREAANQRRTLR